MFKVMSVFGTRPEAIKMAPVIKELARHKGRVESKVCVTAQHRDMLDPFLKVFQIEADYDLNIMQKKQSLEYITSTVLSQMGYILEKDLPDIVLVQGDTTTSMAAALAAFYHKVKVGHIEAGLRTGDKDQPFPEEINRKLIDDISDLYFVHTKEARENLLGEGKNKDNIELTGNTVIDALLDVADQKVDIQKFSWGRIVKKNKRLILLTAHRRESLGEPLKRIFQAVKQLAESADVQIVYPVHLNPHIRKAADSVLGKLPDVHLIEPLDYVSFVHLMKHAFLILTDSGGIQEEAPSLGKPVLVLREITERPEAAAAGAIRVIGTGTEAIVKETSKLLNDTEEYEAMRSIPNPYGDGQAAVRIMERLLKESG